MSLGNSCSDEDVWYLRIPALDANGIRIGAAQKWKEIQAQGLHTHRPGVKFRLYCDKKEKLPFRFRQEEEECVVAIDIAGAESDDTCEFYFEKEYGAIFVDNISARHLSLCWTKTREVNEILAWSGYEVYYTRSYWSNIGIRNLTEGKCITLYADGNIDSPEKLDFFPSELIDSLHKVHDVYWGEG